MKDFTPTESVTCCELKDAPVIKANCTGKETNGADWFAGLVRCEDGQEWMCLNFSPVDQADYPLLYAHLAAGIKAYCKRGE